MYTSLIGTDITDLFCVECAVKTSISMPSETYRRNGVASIFISLFSSIVYVGFLCVLIATEGCVPFPCHVVSSSGHDTSRTLNLAIIMLSLKSSI